jgi:hypothetical protein
MRVRSALAALPLAVCTLMLVAGCTTIHNWFHHQPSPGCHEVPFTGNADTRPPLRVPAGLSAPDTTGAIKIPQLNEPDSPRAHDAPCLDMPPAYGSQPTGLPPRRPQP